MGDVMHSPARPVQVGRPFKPGHDPRRNPGGRAKGLPQLARHAVRDGADLVRFFRAVLKGDAVTLGVSSVPLRDRIEAGKWLADRGWGRVAPEAVRPTEFSSDEDEGAVIVGPDATQDEFIGALQQAIERRELRGQ